MLQQLPLNINHLATTGAINYRRNNLTDIRDFQAGPGSVVTGLTELNWITNIAAKAKAAAAAVKAKAAADFVAIKARAAADIELVKKAAAAEKVKIADDIVRAKAAAGAAIHHFADITKEAAIKAIQAATAAAKAEGVKLANELISDAEAQGHVLTEEAKVKILALAIQVGQDTSDKIVDSEAKTDDFLDAYKNGPLST